MYEVPPKPTQTQPTTNLSKKEIKKLTQKAQTNWKNLSEKYSKNCGIFILNTIGNVIKALTFLQKVEDGDTSEYSMEEQVKMYDVLQSNKDIISMLAQAHSEALRRQAEQEKLKEDEENLAKKAEEEAKRLQEEKEKIENEQKGIETEEKVENKEEEDKKEEDKKEEDKKVSIEDYSDVSKKISEIEKILKEDDLTENEKEQLNDYYQDLLEQKEQIEELQEKEDKKELANELNYNVEDAIKKDEEERKKLIEEENKKIEEQKIEEAKKTEQENKSISIGNLDIPPGTRIYKSQEFPSTGTTYTDDQFQPIKANLCPVDNYGRWTCPEGITSEDIDGWDNIKWERISKIFNTKNYQVFHEEIIADDIIQGGLGDCYFLSAISALCKFPNLVRKLFYFKERSEENCYGVYYKINGTWELVLIDDYFPCYGTRAKNLSFTSTNDNELWVILLEKAWAKLNGNYAKAIGGEPHEVFDVISNAYSDKMKITNNNSEEIWKRLQSAQAKNYLMTAGTSSDTYNLNLEEMGLVPGHAYTLLQVVQLTGKSNEKLVRLRNPWGNTEWSGDWSDSSRKWTSDFRKQCGMEGNNNNNNDGSFWMSFNNFLTYYTMIGICHLYDDFQYTLHHIGNEKSKNGPVLTKVICNEDNVHAYIMLHQKNPRIALKDGTYQTAVINYLMLVDENNNYIKANGNCEKNCCIEVNLNKGCYYLITDINYRYIPNGNIHSYNISAYSSVPIYFEEDNTKNVETVFKNGLYSYTQNNLTSQSFANGKLYQSKSNDSEFPFNFILFDNAGGIYDVTLTDSLVFRSTRCADFYLEGNNNSAESLPKTVVPNTWDIFIHMPYSYSSVYSYSLSTSAKRSTGTNTTNKTSGSSSNTTNTNNKTTANKSSNSQDEIVNAVFSESGEALDSQGLIKQYVHAGDGGYYIGFENGSKRNLNMKLVLDGLYEINNPNSSQVKFTANSYTRRVFSVKVKPGVTGSISFMFDYA